MLLRTIGLQAAVRPGLPLALVPDVPRERLLSFLLRFVPARVRNSGMTTTEGDNK